MHFQEHWVKINKAESKEKSEQAFSCWKAAALEIVEGKNVEQKHNKMGFGEFLFCNNDEVDKTYKSITTEKLKHQTKMNQTLTIWKTN